MRLGRLRHPPPACRPRRRQSAGVRAHRGLFHSHGRHVPPSRGPGHAKAPLAGAERGLLDPTCLQRSEARGAVQGPQRNFGSSKKRRRGGAAVIHVFQRSLLIARHPLRGLKRGTRADRPSIRRVVPDMATLGLIGSGHIGGTLARLAVDACLDVVLSNSRGPQTLSDLVDELGPQARAATLPHTLSSTSTRGPLRSTRRVRSTLDPSASGSVPGPKFCHLAPAVAGCVDVHDLRRACDRVRQGGHGGLEVI
jgi:hypothetical protein